MVHRLQAGEKQVPCLTDFIWLLGMPEFQDIRERGKPEESHVIQPKKRKILQLFTFNNAGGKKPRVFVAHSYISYIEDKNKN